MDEITAIIIAAVAGAALIPLGEFLWNYARAPLRIERDKTEALRQQNSDLQTRLNLTDLTNLAPDWQLRSAYHYLAESLGDGDDVWRYLRDAARLGQIAVWGRKYSLEPPEKNPNAMQPIPPEHWGGFNFDYLKCTFADESAECCSSPDAPNFMQHDQTYQDLHVNEEQVKHKWPVDDI